MLGVLAGCSAPETSPQSGSTGTETASSSSSAGVTGSASSAATGSEAGSTTAQGTSSGQEVTSSGGSDSTGSPSGVSCPPSSPDEVGVVDEAVLVDSDRIVVSRSGTVIENVHVHGDIEIVEGATDVVIRNFRITTDGYWGIFIRDGSNITIEDGEIDGMNAVDDGIRGASYTARRLYIHAMGGDAFKADGNNVLDCNYVTDIGQAPGAHGDGVQMMGDGDIEITGNNFELDSGELTACIFPFGTDPVGGPVRVEGNRLNGGAYIVYCHDTVEVVGNVFGEQYAYGPVTNACALWQDNVWESSGEPVPD